MPTAGSWFRNNVTHSVIDLFWPYQTPTGTGGPPPRPPGTDLRFPNAKITFFLKKNIFDFVSLTLAPFRGGRHPGVLQVRAQQVKRGVAGKRNLNISVSLPVVQEEGPLLLFKGTEEGNMTPSSCKEEEEEEREGG